MGANIEKYISALYEALGEDIAAYDLSFLERTTASRMASLSIDNFNKYLDVLIEDGQEQRELRESLNNSFSEFFRNPLTFAYLEQVVLPHIYERKRLSREKELRIWTVACAEGQEAYSLAILCDQMLQQKNDGIKCRIFATDHDQVGLEKAKLGNYNLNTLGKVSLNRFQSYFTLENGGYLISSSVREIVEFSEFDLLTDNGTSPPSSIYGNFDIVVCKNLLFYYKPEFRSIILQKINKSLASGGYLVTSEAEREIVKGSAYREAFSNSAIFQKK